MKNVKLIKYKTCDYFIKYFSLNIFKVNHIHKYEQLSIECTRWTHKPSYSTKRCPGEV